MSNSKHGVSRDALSTDSYHGLAESIRRRQRGEAPTSSTSYLSRSSPIISEVVTTPADDHSAPSITQCSKLQSRPAVLPPSTTARSAVASTKGIISNESVTSLMKSHEFLGNASFSSSSSYRLKPKSVASIENMAPSSLLATSSSSDAQAVLNSITDKNVISMKYHLNNNTPGSITTNASFSSNNASSSLASISNSFRSAMATWKSPFPPHQNLMTTSSNDDPINDSSEMPFTVDDLECQLRGMQREGSVSVPFDASCMVSGDTIRIFSTARTRTSTFMNRDGAALLASSLRCYNANPNGHKEEIDREMRVDVNGVTILDHLGDENDDDGSTVWKIMKYNIIRGRVSTRRPNNDEQVISFGDVIALCPSIVGINHNTVYALAASSDGGTSSQLCVSPWSESAGLEHQWMVVRGLPGDNGILRIGHSALAANLLLDKKRNRSSQHYHRIPHSTLSQFSTYVRSCDQVVFRSCLNGAVLTVRSDGSLALLCDSYDVNDATPNTYTDGMDRLRRHDILQPTRHELFHVIAAAIPCPFLARITCNELDPQIFLTGSYLLFDQRHEVDAALDSEMIKKSAPTNLAMQCNNAEIEKQRIEDMKRPEYQERVLLDDVIGSFVGLEGHFVKVNIAWSHSLPLISFSLKDDATHSVMFDLSLRNLLEEEILPLSDAFVSIQYFVHSHIHHYEYGYVMQALCQHIGDLLQEHSVFIVDLDRQYTGRMSPGNQTYSILRALQADVRPSLHKLRVLKDIVEAVRYEKGGALLNAMEKLRCRLDGDSVASQLLQLLLDKCAIPYLTMLSKWVESGRLNDPYGEFMVRLNNQSKLWESQFVVDKKNVLARFISSETAIYRIVSTGRFWNAVFLCRYTCTSSDDIVHEFPLQYSSSASEILARVQSLHRKASQVLVKHLLNTCNLRSYLNLAKRYFLLDQGDFFLHFIDAAEVELMKNASDTSFGRVAHLLESAIYYTDPGQGATRVEHTPLSSCITCYFTTSGLLDHSDDFLLSSNRIESDMVQNEASNLECEKSLETNATVTGLETLLLDFKSIPFPVSIVINDQAMANYQLLFRFIFYTKFVERRLVSVWQSQQALRELQSLRGTHGGTFLLRQKMLHFVQNLIFYMTIEVIAPNWMEFESEILADQKCKEQTVDDICSAHSRFLRKTLEACLVTNHNVLCSVLKVLGTCLLFTKEMTTFMQATKLDDSRHTVSTSKIGRNQNNLKERFSSKRHTPISQSSATLILVKELARRKDRIKEQTKRVNQELSCDSYRRMLLRFDDVFSDHLSDFMLQLKYTDDESLFHAHKINLCTRLDYNGFISQALGLSLQSKSRGSIASSS